MNSLVLLLALCSIDIGRSRTVEVPRSIERTLIRVAVGLAASLGSEDGLSIAARMLEGESPSVHVLNPRLYVDGVRDGSPSLRICRSLKRLACFSLNRSRSDDSVELRYTLLYQGLTIRRAVRITEGQITSSAAFACQMGPQGRVRAVRLSYVARESPAGTRITTAATVQVNTGICPERSTSRFRALNRLAGRAAAEQIDEALEEAINEGKRLSDEGHEAIVGHAAKILDALLSRWKHK
jgi:hypothetical protein